MLEGAARFGRCETRNLPTPLVNISDQSRIPYKYKYIFTPIYARRDMLPKHTQSFPSLLHDVGFVMNMNIIYVK